VAYDPLGRDATVNWGAQDLVLENNYETPIAVDSEYQTGKLTFRILGKKTPGLEVKIERSGIRTWSGGGTKTYLDPKLPPGTRKVMESGGVNKQVSTTRVVYMNGEVVKREPLGRSTYSGGMTVIAVGPRARSKPKSTPAPTESADTSSDSVDQSAQE
jgi:vancomycin resistance protein YoaR